MKKAFVVLTVIVVLAMASVASAERGDIGTLEHGCIGGVGCHVAK